jgi:uncharacterized RDD family membrane protein YckC
MSTGIALAGGEPATVHLVQLASVWTLVGANLVGIGLGRRGLYDLVVGTRVVRGGVATRGASSVQGRPPPPAAHGRDRSTSGRHP